MHDPFLFFSTNNQRERGKEDAQYVYKPNQTRLPTSQLVKRVDDQARLLVQFKLGEGDLSVGLRDEGLEILAQASEVLG